MIDTRRRDRKAWVAKRRGADGKLRYDVRWLDRTGRERSEMVRGGLGDANQRAARKTEELNTVGDIALVRWADFMKDHVASLEGASADYVKGHTRTLDKFSQYGPEYVCDVTAGDIDRFKAGMFKTGVSKTTVDGQLRVVKAALLHAVKNGLLQRCPIGHIDPAPCGGRALSADECKKLLVACPGEYWRAFIYTALTTGARKMELVNVQWADIDLLTGLVNILNRPGARTKSGKDRITSTDETGCALLTRIRLNHPDAVKVFTDTGGALTVNRIDRGFKAIVEGAGIPACTLHDLRRTSLTLLATRLPAFALQQRAGHVYSSTTATYYIGDTALASAAVAKTVLGEVFKEKREQDGNA